MTTKTMIYKLLYLALIEIRYEAHEAKHAKIFHLTDLFHNTPLSLDRAAVDEDYDELMEWITNRATEKGIEGWLEHQIKFNV